MNTEQTIKLIVLCTCEIINTETEPQVLRKYCEGEGMKEKNRIWVIFAIIIAVLLIGYWILSSPRIEKDVNQQSKEVIEDLTID